MRGSFEVAASSCFCSLSGFFTVAYRLPSVLARAPRQPRPALSVFVCFMAAPFVPVDDPFLSVSFPLSKRSDLLLPSSPVSCAPFLLFIAALRGPTYGIVAALLRAWASFYNLVQPSWGGTDLRRCSPSLAHPEDHP